MANQNSAQLGCDELQLSFQTDVHGLSGIHVAPFIESKFSLVRQGSIPRGQVVFPLLVPSIPNVDILVSIKELVASMQLRLLSWASR